MQAMEPMIWEDLELQMLESQSLELPLLQNSKRNSSNLRSSKEYTNKK